MLDLSKHHAAHLLGNPPTVLSFGAIEDGSHDGVCHDQFHSQKRADHQDDAFLEPPMIQSSPRRLFPIDLCFVIGASEPARAIFSTSSHKLFSGALSNS